MHNCSIIDLAGHLFDGESPYGSGGDDEGDGDVDGENGDEDSENASDNDEGDEDDDQGGENSEDGGEGGGDGFGVDGVQEGGNGEDEIDSGIMAFDIVGDENFVVEFANKDRRQYERWEGEDLAGTLANIAQRCSWGRLLGGVRIAPNLRKILFRSGFGIRCAKEMSSVALATDNSPPLSLMTHAFFLDVITHIMHFPST